jgi:hypothetical protein
MIKFRYLSIIVLLGCASSIKIKLPIEYSGWVYIVSDKNSTNINPQKVSESVYAISNEQFETDIEIDFYIDATRIDTNRIKYVKKSFHSPKSETIQEDRTIPIDEMIEVWAFYICDEQSSLNNKAYWNNNDVYRKYSEESRKEIRSLIELEIIKK